MARPFIVKFIIKKFGNLWYQLCFPRHWKMDGNTIHVMKQNDDTEVNHKSTRDKETRWSAEERRKKYLLSIEMLLRKSLKQSFREYIQHCSLGGIKQIFDPDIGNFRRSMWIAVFIGALAQSIYFLTYVWTGTLSKPLIVTMETLTYPISKIDFPAIAVCNINRISKRKLRNFTEHLYPKLITEPSERLPQRDLPILRDLVAQMGRLIDFSYNATWKDEPLAVKILEYYRNNDKHIIRDMKQLAPQCEDLLLRCAWSGTLADCDKLFSFRRTTHGHCCTFNFVLDYSSTGLPIMTKHDLRHQKEPGYYHGLNVLLDAQIDDYSYPLNAMEGFDILIYRPTIYPDLKSGRVIHRIVQPNTGVFFEINAVKQMATNEVRKYSVATRNCFFQDENKKKYNYLYSQSACIVKCRLDNILSLCKCSPYFVPNDRTTESAVRVCTMEDLKCLNKYREKLFYLYPIKAENTEGLEEEMSESLYCVECLPECEHLRYYTQSHEIPLTTKDYAQIDVPNLFFEGFNMTDKSYMSVYFPVPDSTLDRLDTVSYWYEIMSNIGGFSGLMIGFSVVSVLEIIYFLLIRSLRLLKYNYDRTAM